jgi:hypothetical protein
MVVWRTFECPNNPEASLFHETFDADLTIETSKEPFAYWSNDAVGIV